MFQIRSASRPTAGGNHSASIFYFIGISSFFQFAAQIGARGYSESHFFVENAGK